MAKKCLNVIPMAQSLFENGKIYIDGGYSTSGVKVDSIYFEAEFDWAPGEYTSLQAMAALALPKTNTSINIR
jgi:hypothetical protein